MIEVAPYLLALCDALHDSADISFGMLTPPGGEEVGGIDVARTCSQRRIVFTCTRKCGGRVFEET
jgi:hypothetical protein